MREAVELPWTGSAIKPKPSDSETSGAKLDRRQKGKIDDLPSVCSALERSLITRSHKYSDILDSPSSCILSLIPGSAAMLRSIFVELDSLLKDRFAGCFKRLCRCRLFFT